MTDKGYPESAKEAVEMWDNDKTIWTIEMGGLGPGYEQCIQLLTMEVLRDHMNDQIPEKGTDEMKSWWKNFGEGAVKRTDEKVGGYSGAQVGAAKNLAYHFLMDGWEGVMSHPDVKDRHIQVNKIFPTI